MTTQFIFIQTDHEASTLQDSAACCKRYSPVMTQPATIVRHGSENIRAFLETKLSELAQEAQ